MVTHKPKTPPAGPRRARDAGAAPLLLRPIARVERIGLFEREVRERLSRAAIDLLLARADLISEGQRTVRNGRDVYLGSTMMTIDLQGLGSVLRDSPEAATARRLADLLSLDPVVAALVEAIAAREATKHAGTPPRTLNTELTVTARGTKVFIDVDVEGAL